jgi:hypothetical protein
MEVEGRGEGWLLFGLRSDLCCWHGGNSWHPHLPLSQLPARPRRQHAVVRKLQPSFSLKRIRTANTNISLVLVTCTCTYASWRPTPPKWCRSSSTTSLQGTTQLSLNCIWKKKAGENIDTRLDIIKSCSINKIEEKVSYKVALRRVLYIGICFMSYRKMAKGTVLAQLAQQVSFVRTYELNSFFLLQMHPGISKF